MNDNVKGIIGFVIGAAVSGVSVWLYQDKKLSAQFLKEIEDYKKSLDGKKVDENNDIPESVLEASKAMRETGKDEDKENADISKSSPAPSTNSEDKLKRPVDTRKTNYSALTRGYTSSDKSDTEESLKEDKKGMKVNAYYISEDDYYSDNIPVGYKTYELFLSADDKELFHENGDVFVDPQTAFGWDLYNEIQKAKEPVYIRNDDLKELYSIDIEG